MNVGHFALEGDNIFYDGINVPVDFQYARDWLKTTKLTPVECTIFGENTIQLLPLGKGEKDITSDILSAVASLVVTGIMEHQQLRRIEEVCKQYVITTGGLFSIREKKHVNMRDILLAKEMLDGYYNFGYYRGKGDVPIVPIGQEYDITLRGKTYKVYGSFAPSIREGFYYGSDFFQRTGKLRQDRQNMSQILMGHITYILLKRRSGKSLLAVDSAIREITKQRKQEKPNKVVFVSYDDGKLDDIRHYLKEYQTKFPGMYEFKGDAMRFYTYEEVNGEIIKTTNGVIELYTSKGSFPGVGAFADLIVVDEAGLVSEKVINQLMPIVAEEGARLLVVSTVYEDVGFDHRFFRRWSAAYYQTIGANYVEKIEQLFIDNYDTITNGTNIEMKDLTEKVKTMMPEVGLLWTKDDVEMFSEKQESAEKIMKKTSPLEYFAQCRGVVPSNSRMINIGKCVKEVPPVDYEFKVITRDPAQAFDMSAVVVKGYRDGIIYDIEEHILNPEKEAYPIQIQKFQEIERSHKEQGKKVYTIIDQKGVGNVLSSFFPLFGVKFDAFIITSGGNAEGVSVKEPGVFTASKRYMVEVTKNIINNGCYIIDPALQNIITHYKTYGKKKTTSGAEGFEGASGAKDDFATASNMGNLFIRDILGKRKDYAKKTYINIIGEQQSKDPTIEDVLTEKKKPKIDMSKPRNFSNYIY